MQQNDDKRDVLSEADRQRQEEIKLKKIRQGLIDDDESREYQQRREKEKNTPQTPVEKLQNFWYHNKWPTIIIGFIVIVSAYFTYQMFTKPKFDTTVLFCSNSFYTEESTNTLADEVADFLPDINGDGKVQVGVFQANYAADEQELTGMETAIQARILAEITSGKNCIFVIDKTLHKAYVEQGVFADLTKLIGVEGEEPVYGFSVKDTKLLKNKVFANMRDDCVVAIRVYKEGTDKESYDAQVSAVKKIYESVKK